MIRTRPLRDTIIIVLSVLHVPVVAFREAVLKFVGRVTRQARAFLPALPPLRKHALALTQHSAFLRTRCQCWRGARFRFCFRLCRFRFFCSGYRSSRTCSTIATFRTRRAGIRIDRNAFALDFRDVELCIRDTRAQHNDYENRHYDKSFMGHTVFPSQPTTPAGTASNSAAYISL